MEDLIKWVIENKSLLIIACITLSVSIPISVHFGKTIINYNIKKNKTINNYKTNSQLQNSNAFSRSEHSTANISGSNNMVELTKISLYSTGKKGKVYTTKFYKSINHNFGIEITLKNNTIKTQNAKVGWCIYKDGNEIAKGNFNKKINPNSSLTTDFYVKEKAFKHLNIGKYKSQFWVNNVKVQKVFFDILNK